MTEVACGGTYDDGLDPMVDQLWELYWEFRRLKGYPAPSTAPINKMIDAATGLEDKILSEFADFLVSDILPRLPPVEGYQKWPETPARRLQPR